MDLPAIRREIPCLARCIYTNTAGFGPLPRPVWEDLRRREEAIYEKGLDVLAHDPGWNAEREEWRARVAAQFGAAPDEIGFGRALGEGLNLVISGMEWRDGDEIVITDQEHPTGLFPALNLAARHGVQVRKLRVAASDAENLERYAALLTPRTRLVAISGVTTEVGVRLPMAAMGAVAAERDVPLYLDLAQVAGQMPLDLHATGCAFAAASGSKWLLGPLGTAWFYVRQEWAGRLKVSWTGSSGGSTDAEGEVFEPAAGARRFEFGGRHWPLIGAMALAIDWVSDFGWSAIEEGAAALATELKRRLAEIPGAQVLTPAAPAASTGIVTFSLAGRRNSEVVNALRDRWRIRSRPTMFNGTRISLAFFNTEEEVERIAAGVQELAAEPGQ